MWIHALTSFICKDPNECLNIVQRFVSDRLKLYVKSFSYLAPQINTPTGYLWIVIINWLSFWVSTPLGSTSFTEAKEGGSGPIPDAWSFI